MIDNQNESVGSLKAQLAALDVGLKYNQDAINKTLKFSIRRMKLREEREEMLRKRGLITTQLDSIKTNKNDIS